MAEQFQTTAVRGQGLRGQRPEQVAAEEVKEEDEGHQPMFKSFPIAGHGTADHGSAVHGSAVHGSALQGSAAERNVESPREVPRYDSFKINLF